MADKKAEYSRIYNKDYFHGVNSGYPAEGYEHAHPTWQHWIDFVKDNMKAEKWLDIGCAYGYLVSQARESGIKAFGIDVSTYALEQLPEVKDYISYQDAHEPEFPDGNFDVISCLDTIEHLRDPEKALLECRRMLKSGGWLILSTPDPIYFKDQEITHCNERVPSCWINMLKELGFSLAFRFPGEIHNLEILAVNDGKGGFLPDAQQDKLGVDFLGSFQDILDRSGIGSKDLYACLRSNWSIAKDSSRHVLTGKFGGIYLLNLSKTPKKIKCRIEFNCVTADKVFATLDYVTIYSNEKSLSDGHRDLSFDFILPYGGHLLGLSLISAVEKIYLEKVDLDISEARSQYLTDQYIRYKFIGDAVNALKKQSRTKLNILDVGGAPGQIFSFVPDEDVSILDKRWIDIPGFIKNDFLQQEVLLGKYDLVISVDTLEHIPDEDRESFLAKLIKLSNNSVILIAPFNSKEVQMAESVLQRYLKTGFNLENTYLEEHKKFGLPDLEGVKRFFAKKGYECIEVPLFYLKHWGFIMLYDFICDKEGMPLSERVRSYNRDFPDFFHLNPSYEKAIFFSKNHPDLLLVGRLAAEHKAADNHKDNGFENYQMELLANLLRFYALRMDERADLFDKQIKETLIAVNDHNNLLKKINKPSAKFLLKIIKNFIFSINKA